MAAPPRLVPEKTVSSSVEKNITDDRGMGFFLSFRHCDFWSQVVNPPKKS